MVIKKIIFISGKRPQKGVFSLKYRQDEICSTIVFNDIRFEWVFAKPES